MSKRAASELDEYEEKLELASSDGGSDDYTQSSSKAQKNRKRPKKAKNEDGSTSHSGAKRVWTAEEDRIFLELMGRLVKEKMWEVISVDGRLAYRGNPGIRAHVTAMMNKMKKP